jgi:2-polyprenyl-3-methyl-5-hydroxy-6-metoxy-1,4-benzoquinol methylase
MNNNKFIIQESLYDFPYHYIPHFNKNGTPSLSRKLGWGFDYLCYMKHLQKLVISMNPNSVLEVGCGDGYFIGNLPTSIPIRVGVDVSSKAIAFAKAFHPNCVFYDFDAEKIEDKFDVVIVIEVLEHIPDDELSFFFQTLSKKVKQEGKIIVSVPTTVVPLNNKHYRHYTIELFENQLKFSGINFKIVNVEYVFSSPLWLKTLTRLFDNRFFGLEIKSLMRLAWNQIWRKHRIVNKKYGVHMVVELIKN